MSVYKKNNKFISYLIVLGGLFILILFTKGEVSKMQENFDSKETYSIELDSKIDKLKKLNSLKKELSGSNIDLTKYNIDIKENELIDYIYGYVESINDTKGVTFIRSISMNKPVDTEIGFKETLINLNLKVPNINKLKDILDFLTSDNSKYNFFITGFTFPYGENDKSFNVTIPLKILHK